MKKLNAFIPVSASLEGVEPSEQPSSPKTQSKISKMKDVLVTIQAKPPSKEKPVLYPRQTVIELVEASNAAPYARVSPKKATEDVPGEIYTRMSNIIEEMHGVICSLPAREVTQAILDEELSKLATAVYPDSSDKLKWKHYVKAVDGLLPQVLKDNDKAIIQASQLTKGKEPATEPKMIFLTMTPS